MVLDGIGSTGSDRDSCIVRVSLLKCRAGSKGVERPIGTSTDLRASRRRCQISLPVGTKSTSTTHWLPRRWRHHLEELAADLARAVARWGSGVFAMQIQRATLTCAIVLQQSQSRWPSSEGPEQNLQMHLARQRKCRMQKRNHTGEEPFWRFGILVAPSVCTAGCCDQCGLSIRYQRVGRRNAPAHAGGLGFYVCLIHLNQ